MVRTYIVYLLVDISNLIRSPESQYRFKYILCLARDPNVILSTVTQLMHVTGIRKIQRKRISDSIYEWMILGMLIPSLLEGTFWDCYIKCERITERSLVFNSKRVILNEGW